MSIDGTKHKAKESSLGLLRWMREMHALLPRYVRPLLVFSLAINLLMLVAPLYMLQVYDRVLTSGSSDTLFWLTAIAVFLLIVYAAAETGRRRLSGMAAESLEDALSDSVFAQFATSPHGGRSLTANIGFLARIRAALQNNMLAPIFDLPFAPLFLISLFMIHPVIGSVGLAGAFAIFTTAIVAEIASREINRTALEATNEAQQMAAGFARQRSAMVAMGFVHAAQNRWRALRREARTLNMKAIARESAFSATARSLRQVLQIIILGVGAALAIQQQISPGAIVAGSILMSRALAPIDQLVGGWRNLTQSGTAWRMLADSLEAGRHIDPSTPLPRPEAELSISRMSVAAPDGQTMIIRPFSLSLTGGEFICIAGANGAGKSSLLQTLAGVWPTAAGAVSLGGRSIHEWSSEDRGQYVGYVPQDVELLHGTIFENIARMQDAEPNMVYDAAKRAGAHDMILAMPNGYETKIGSEKGRRLSAGQRQLIGLARAFFNQPILLLLDEPSANLDLKSTQLMVEALQGAAANGDIVVAASHDRRLIAGSQTTLLVQNGSVVSMKSPEFLSASSQSENRLVSISGTRA